MEFDFDTFTKVVERCYHENQNRYTLDDVLFVFREYFKAYEDFTGAVHPFIRVAQIKSIISAMPEVKDVLGRKHDINPLEYREMIAQHFVTDYKKCDYNINHFFTGVVRAHRLFETRE